MGLRTAFSSAQLGRLGDGAAETRWPRVGGEVPAAWLLRFPLKQRRSGNIPWPSEQGEDGFIDRLGKLAPQREGSIPIPTRLEIIPNVIVVGTPGLNKPGRQQQFQAERPLGLEEEQLARQNRQQFRGDGDRHSLADGDTVFIGPQGKPDRIRPHGGR
jgi:hypothetical protein